MAALGILLAAGVSAADDPGAKNDDALEVEAPVDGAVDAAALADFEDRMTEASERAGARIDAMLRIQLDEIAEGAIAKRAESAPTSLSGEPQLTREIESRVRTRLDAESNELARQALAKAEHRSAVAETRVPIEKSAESSPASIR